MADDDERALRIVRRCVASFGTRRPAPWEVTRTVEPTCSTPRTWPRSANPDYPGERLIACRTPHWPPNAPATAQSRWPQPRPFMPSRVWRVTALPKTRSAKVMRRAIRAAALGIDPGDLSGAENPDAVSEIRRLVATSMTPDGHLLSRRR